MSIASASSTNATTERTLYAVIAALSVGVLAYSQVTTLDWDEGFHLVAASLIAAGKRPYIDFCFPQPWLHALWNALWLSLGGGWRVLHAVAAVLTCGTMAMTADFVFRRVGDTVWRLPAACVAAMLVGLNPLMVEFGTKAQAYGACTFLTVAAFRVTVGGSGMRRTVLAGCLAGAAAACSLLAAPVCPVLFLWHCGHRRWSHAAAFLGALLIPLSPVLSFLVKAPSQTWFNLVAYHVFYRHVGWEGATQNDFEVLSSWIDSAQALLLGILAVTGIWLARREEKAELYLAAALSVALAAEAAVAHPTFPQYFVFVVPFLAMPAGLGFREAVSRLGWPRWWVVAAAAVILASSLGNSLVQMRDANNTWTVMETMAKKIAQVTPAGASVLADSPVYFAMRRQPPSGMEFPASHKLELPAEMADALHIVPQSVLQRRVRAGEFATVETCKGDEDEIRALGLSRLYSQSMTIAGCVVYWGFK